MTSPTPTERLEAGIGELRVPEPKADQEAMFLTAGVVIAAVGFVFIAAAWWGASGTRDVTDQIPYLISGGLVGLGLVTVGIGLVLRFSLARLFRFWLARLLAEHQLQTDRTVDALGRIEALLAGQHPVAPAAPPIMPDPAASQAFPPAPSV